MGREGGQVNDPHFNVFNAVELHARHRKRCLTDADAGYRRAPIEERGREKDVRVTSAKRAEGGKEARSQRGV